MRNGLPLVLGRHVRHALANRRLSAVPTTFATVGRAARCSFHRLHDNPRPTQPHRHQHTASAQVVGDDYRSLDIISCDNETGRPSNGDTSVWHHLDEEQDPERMIEILEGYNVNDGIVPLQVLQRLLDRDHIPAAILGRCQSYVKEHYAGTDIEVEALQTLCEGFFRHAGRTSPELIHSTVDILLHHFQKITQSEEATILKTKMLNTMLCRIADAPEVRPYRSSGMQEAALFRIVGYMAEHDPPITVTREGYRAVVRVQLRLPKSEEEQAYARLQAKSWPPWKQDRHAMDSELGPEFGLSKAKQTLRKQAQAGYSADDWDKVASMYAGWDEDNTPTIQTRQVLKHDPAADMGEVSKWTARITTTRTLQEAWAIWLEFRSLKGFDYRPAIAIVNRLYQEEVRLRKGLVSEALPGDGYEIHAPPSSVHLHTYTRTEPATVHEFFHSTMDEVRARGVRFDFRLASKFVALASTFQHCCEYLEALDNHFPGAGLIMRTNDATHLKNVPPLLLLSAVRNLCRFVAVPNEHAQPIEQLGWTALPVHSNDEAINSNVDLPFFGQHNFVRAVWLAKQLEPWRQQKAWLAILRVLSESRKNVRMQYMNLHTADLVGDRQQRFSELTAKERVRFRYDVLTLQNYQLALQVQEMSLADARMTMDGWYELTRLTADCAWSCMSTAQAYIAANGSDYLRLVHREAGLTATIVAIHKTKPARLIMDRFKVIAGLTVHKAADAADSSEDKLGLSVSWSDINEDRTGYRPFADIPQTHSSVDAGHFHQWVRAIGLWAEHDHMLHLLRQICQARTIDVYSDNTPRADRMMRDAVVAVRVFLERTWVDNVPKEADSASKNQNMLDLYRIMTTPAKQAQIEEAKVLLVQRFGEDLGHWASDDEFVQYCSDGHLGRYRRKGVF